MGPVDAGMFSRGDDAGRFGAGFVIDVAEEGDAGFGGFGFGGVGGEGEGGQGEEEDGGEELHGVKGIIGGMAPGGNGQKGSEVDFGYWSVVYSGCGSGNMEVPPARST